jgi:hypothetical protein
VIDELPGYGENAQTEAARAGEKSDDLNEELPSHASIPGERGLLLRSSGTLKGRNRNAGLA